MEGLRKFMLAGNLLSELPSSFKSLSSLELLRLSNNKLTKFPMELLSLPKLAWLALAGNEFNKINHEEEGGGNKVRGEVTYDLKSLLGSGASGLVYKGTLRLEEGNNDDVIEVAVKLFRDANTSDGSPKDEMAVAQVAGSTGCLQLMKSYGQLPNETIKKSSADCEEKKASLGLVLEMLEGYDVIAQPPSFQSVTRDQYTSNFDYFTLKNVLSILIDVCNAATTLHRLGIVHGDLYGHNILHKYNNTESSEGSRSHSVLSDFGASFFYKGRTMSLNCSGEINGSDEECGNLLERIEVLAFGYLIQELIEQITLRGVPMESSDNVIKTLGMIASSCCIPTVNMRPSFSSILGQLKSCRQAS